MFLKIHNFLLLCCCFLFLPGCWDNRNIEELTMEVGAAFDKNDEGNNGMEQGKQPKRNTIKLTLQNVSHTLNSTQQNQDETTPHKNYENLVGTGDTVIEIIRDFSLKKDRTPFGQHLKVIVIGEKIAREMNLNVLLNLFMRTYEVRDSCILLVSQGPADEALKGDEDFPSLRLHGIQKNRYRTTKLLPETTLGTAGSKMAGRSSFVIQGIAANKGKVRFNSAAVIKGNTQKLVGFLNEQEVIGLNWLLGELQGGILKAKNDKTNQYLIYEISSLKSKIIPHVEGKRIWFDVKIESVGRLREDWYRYSKVFDNRYIKQMETAVKKEVERLIKRTIDKSQKKYHVDIARFGDQIRIHYPETWKQVKSNWDTVFCKLPINYQVKITIDDYLVKVQEEI